jgi:hypothetical protein
MTPWKIIKLVLFLSALGWTAANVAWLFMAAAADGSNAHIVAHLVAAIGCGAIAWFLRPRRHQRRRTVTAGDPRVDVLESEVSDLQRQLNETQQSLNFTEQLLAQRPESRKDQP